jgi:hypothetical protein
MPVNLNNLIPMASLFGDGVDRKASFTLNPTDKFAVIM